MRRKWPGAPPKATIAIGGQLNADETSQAANRLQLERWLCGCRLRLRAVMSSIMRWRSGVAGSGAKVLVTGASVSSDKSLLMGVRLSVIEVPPEGREHLDLRSPRPTPGSLPLQMLTIASPAPHSRNASCRLATSCSGLSRQVGDGGYWIITPIANRLDTN